MIINKDDYTYQRRSDKPNENWMGSEYYLLEDDSELANKFIEYFPYIILTIKNNEIINVEEDTLKKEDEERKRNIANQMQQLKKKLAETDYKAIKYAEGFISEKDYVEIKAQRQAWRDEINRLEAIENG